ncbi:MAG: type II secretion system F family protein [Sarcina sp.]
MAKFKYRAIDSSGAINENSGYEAETEQDLRTMLISNGLSPLSIEEIGGSKEIDLNFVSKISTRDLAIFCRQFATMVEAGVTINYAMTILANQTKKKKFKAVLTKVDEDIKKGSSLSDAMAIEKDYFPPLLINMIEVGESSGRLDEVMNSMAVYYEKQHKMNGKIRNAMIYPIILAIVTFVVMTIILVFVMPMFIDMFESSGAALPITTKITLALSTALREYWYIFVLAIGAMGGAFYVYTAKTEDGIYRYNYFRLKYSPFKDLNQKIVVSRFTRTLATILGAGVNMINSLDIVGGVLGNKFADTEIKKVKDRVLKGEGLAKPIEDTKVFPVMLSSMIKIGEESGSLDSILEKTADFYDDELERAIEALTSIIEPIILVIMGIVVGFLIISVLTPMFEMFHVI